MPFTGADHVVILVRDIDQAIHTWQNQFGLPLSHRADLPEVGIRQAFFLLEDNTFLELIAPMGEQSPIEKVLESRGEGVHTLALKVDDLDATVEKLESQGVQLMGLAHRRFSYIRNRQMGCACNYGHRHAHIVGKISRVKVASE